MKVDFTDYRTPTSYRQVMGIFFGMLQIEMVLKLVLASLQRSIWSKLEGFTSPLISFVLIMNFHKFRKVLKAQSFVINGSCNFNSFIYRWESQDKKA